MFDSDSFFGYCKNPRTHRTAYLFELDRKRAPIFISGKRFYVPQNIIHDFEDGTYGLFTGEQLLVEKGPRWQYSATKRPVPGKDTDGVKKTTEALTDCKYYDQTGKPYQSLQHAFEQYARLHKDMSIQWPLFKTPEKIEEALDSFDRQCRVWGTPVSATEHKQSMFNICLDTDGRMLQASMPFSKTMVIGYEGANVHYRVEKEEIIDEIKKVYAPPYNTTIMYPFIYGA